MLSMLGLPSNFQSAFASINAPSDPKPAPKKTSPLDEATIKALEQSKREATRSPLGDAEHQKQLTQALALSQKEQHQEVLSVESDDDSVASATGMNNVASLFRSKTDNASAAVNRLQVSAHKMATYQSVSSPVAHKGYQLYTGIRDEDRGSARMCVQSEGLHEKTEWSSPEHLQNYSKQKERMDRFERMKKNNNQL